EVLFDVPQAAHTLADGVDRSRSGGEDTFHQGLEPELELDGRSLRNTEDRKTEVSRRIHDELERLLGTDSSPQHLGVEHERSRNHVKPLFECTKRTTAHKRASVNRTPARHGEANRGRSVS